jgi:serine/threonine-protein kinase
MSGDGIAHEAVLEHLTRVLSSTPFRGANRSAVLLRYLVERSLDGSADRLKEYTVGAEALGRGPRFDPRIDPIVRAEASRLRSRLERYYAGEGRADAVVIELPKGTYVPRFYARTPVPTSPPPPEGESPPRQPPYDELSQREPSHHEPPYRGPSHGRPILWTALGVLTTLGAFALGARLARPSPSSEGQALVRLDVQLQSTGLVSSEVGTDVVLAPDGSRAVFVSRDSIGVAHLRTRRFDGSAPVDLPGTDGARGPFWSPDGRWVGFWAAGQLRKIAVDGGSPVVLCNATDLLGASWSDDGTIIAALDATSRLWRVSASGGTPAAVLDLTTEREAPRWPQLLPDGTHVIYTALTAFGADRATVEVASLSGGQPRVLVRGGTFGRYVAPGYLTYVNQGTLYAVRFDTRHLEVHGPPVPIVDDVAYSATFGYAQLSISRRGLAAYRRAPASGRLVVALLDSAGRRTPLVDTPGRYSWPALSPDGQHLALSVVESGVPGIAMFAAPSGHLARATWRVRGHNAAAWTRDGRFLVAGGAHGLVWMSAANGETRTLVNSPNISVPWSFAPDDRRLMFAAMSAATAFDLWTVDLEKTSSVLRAGSPTPLLRSPFFETYPTVSPDGRWLAYASNQSGTWEVYVRSLTDSGATAQVSRGGGRVPRWSRASARLYFGTDDQRIMVAPYTVSNGRFAAGVPRQWTPVRLADTGVLPSFDVGVDDRHIVALLPAARPAEAQAANHVTLMWNFADELRRRVR